MRRFVMAGGLLLLILGLLAALVLLYPATPQVRDPAAPRPPVAVATAVAQADVSTGRPPPAAAATSTTAAAAPLFDSAARAPEKAPAAGGASAADPLAPVPAAPTAPAEGPAIQYGNPAASTYQSPLTAGQVDDNVKFADYLTFLRNYQGPPVHPIAVDRRLFVRVVDGQQHPVAGVRVQLFDGSRPVFDGRTVADGRALFFPNAAGATQAARFRAVVSRGQQQVETTVAGDQPETTVSLAKLADNTGPVGLDLVFLLDSTGSMGDEIDTIKATVDSIATRIEQVPGSSRPRFGLVTFRDRGDDYVTRSWDFTADVQQFAANLGGVTAAGGGDTPESVNAGLHDAIHLPGWAPQDSGRHLRMIVLVGDAPPHLDYPNDYEYTTLLRDAAAAGIQIFPIGASGLDDQGEYIFRQYAEVTQGQFVFITYANGVSGAPGPATDHHVDDYTVQNLDSLVVGLVAEQIARQTGASGQTGQPPIDHAAGPVASEDRMPPDVPVAMGGPDLLAQVNAWLNGGVPLWALGLVVLGLWAGRGTVRARRAGPAAQAFAAPVTPDDLATRTLEPRAVARVTPDAVAIPAAAQVLGPPTPFLSYIYTAQGHPTTPLPALGPTSPGEPG